MLRANISRRMVIAILSTSLLLLVGLSGCGHTYSQPAPYYPPTTSVQTATTPSTIATITSQIISGGYYAHFPSNGAYVTSGSTLSLSWSADGNLECFILTENQFNNFKSRGIVSVWEAYGSGASGAISASIRNSDMYYAVVRNTYMLAPSVKLYQAVLTKR